MRESRSTDDAYETSAFRLHDHPTKADPALIGDDEQHFAAVAGSLAFQIADLTERLEELRRSPGGAGRAAMDRDLEIHRLSGQLRHLRRFGLDVCLGRMIRADDDEPTYVGRIGLTDHDGRRLLVDWRTPAAEPFFGATHATPMGLRSRRRYRWTSGRVSDYWDEVFGEELIKDGVQNQTTLDDQSAFIASLGSSRSPQMRDVLSTIQADQDAIIRAGSRGALVVDGGPGTGKTVVALHRAAYLLYSDPHLSGRKGGVLFVGPHRPYLAYIADVLPRLGEEGVQTCTLRDLVAEGAAARHETDPEIVALKQSLELVRAIEPAVGLYEEPPRQGLMVDTEWADLWISAADWAEAFESVDPGTPHNEARDHVREVLVSNLLDEHDDDGEIPYEKLAAELRQHPELNEALNNAWTLIEAADLVGDLWTVPAYLRRCAPGLTLDQVRLLQREEPKAWTVEDLPLIDAARLRLGDPESVRRQRKREIEAAAQRAYMDQVVTDLLQADPDSEGSLQMLRRDSIRDDLIDEAGLASAEPDALAGPFTHIIVDEAQELTDAEWQMLLNRCPSRSFTIVGDRAQARHGFTESWQERLQRIGLDMITMTSLSINYRTPTEVMTEAEPVIRAVLPDANVPTSIRSSGVPIHHGAIGDRDLIVDSWMAEHPEGIACVIGDPTFVGTSRVRSLSPETSKGLEFDLVILVDPQSWGGGIEGSVDRYVAMTRATQRLVILTSR